MVLWWKLQPENQQDQVERDGPDNLHGEESLHERVSDRVYPIHSFHLDLLEIWHKCECDQPSRSPPSIVEASSSKATAVTV